MHGSHRAEEDRRVILPPEFRLKQYYDGDSANLRTAQPPILRTGSRTFFLRSLPLHLMRLMGSIPTRTQPSARRNDLILPDAMSASSLLTATKPVDSSAYTTIISRMLSPGLVLAALNYRAWPHISKQPLRNATEKAMFSGRLMAHGAGHCKEFEPGAIPQKQQPA